MNKKGPLSVLHLTPHVGGGVGTVLRALIENSNSEGGFVHTLLALEPINHHMQEWCKNSKVTFFENGWDNRDKILSLLAGNDIVHIHWWNHPLLHGLLVSPALPPMRTVLWSHVNGLSAPQIFFQSLLNFPDFFVLATPYSEESPLLSLSDQIKPGQIRLIQSNAGVPKGAAKHIIKPDQFQAGYIGTVDYSKMHRDFISLWHETELTETPLLVCGGPSEEQLQQEVAARNLAHLFDIRGVVTNVAELFADLQVFFYPLNSTHYGTGEQVLLEAMSFGVVPVVMDNGCERFLVQDGETGIIASGKEDFIQALRYLKNNPDKWQEMAEKGCDFVRKNFAIEQTVAQWHALYREVATLDKRNHCLALAQISDLSLHSTATLLVNSYGDSRAAQQLRSLLSPKKDQSQEEATGLPPACFAETRGSPFHYQRLLPRDPALDRICRELQQKKMVGGL